MQAAQLLERLLTCISDDIVPLTARRIADGRGKVFGAAILRKSDLSLVIAECNIDVECPLWHGETYCIKRFYDLPPTERPSPKDCFFLTTHEPCSLCLSAITWSGFDNFYYFFTHEESRDNFDDPYDMKVIQSVFKTPVEGEPNETRERHALYNRKNEFFEAISLDGLLGDVEDAYSRERLAKKMTGLRVAYVDLVEKQRKNKAGFALTKTSLHDAEPGK
ncbi:CMP/dCMP deaminase [Fomitopsis serialis]|uniref:CMP/dCMP deaminase n=1 Tax=Fomitopsis serialis TaxID=139415 RepID=UPI002007DF1E|nr:CMP/dCMP deaminase [Neoantrodia serialis]KAH9920450.1 CMP/dCMP deaminase [Neoantrodia serialis]